MKKIINTPNGIQEVNLTAEEITEKENSKQNFLAEQEAFETVKTAKANAQASGNTKLLGLGLTQAEATAMTGYTPE